MYAILFHPPATMEDLYVLQLQNGKYYVGKTADINRRYAEHKAGHGSAWTSMHRPIKIMEVRPLKDEHDENNTTKDLMKKYGVDNVRGGSYTQAVLPASYKAAVQAEIRGNTGACFKCGEMGHFARDCCDSDGEDAAWVWQCEHCPCEFATEKQALAHEKTCGGQMDQGAVSRSYGTCYRCGRAGHWAPDCYASRHVKGYTLDSDSD